MNFIKQNFLAIAIIISTIIYVWGNRYIIISNTNTVGGTIKHDKLLGKTYVWGSKGWALLE